MTSIVQFLKTVKIFENLTEEELAELAPLFDVRNVRNKEHVCVEGEVSDVFCIVRSGRFNITKGYGKEALIDVLGPKDCFGEAGLFHDAKRSANMTATEDAQILLLHRDQFQQFLVSHPLSANRILFAMLKEVFRRIEGMSERTA